MQEMSPQTPQTQPIAQQPVGKPLPSYKRLIYFILRNPWISLTVLLIGLAIVFVLLTPEPTSRQTTPLPIAVESPTTTLSKLQTVRYVGTPPDFPNSVQIYSLPVAPSGAQRAQELAGKLGLRKVADQFLTNLWENPDTQTSLYYDENYERIEYTKAEAATTPQATPPTSTPLNLSTAVSVAQAFVTTQLGFSNFTAQTEEVRYLSHEYEDPDVNTAEAAIIPFQFSIDGFAVKFSQFEQPLITATVNKKYEVSNAVFYPSAIQPTPLQTTSTINVEQALGNIRTGKTTITSAFISTGRELAFEEITTLELDSVVIEYRINSQKTTLVPYYVFFGTAITQGQETYDIHVITPAIEPNSLR